MFKKILDNCLTIGSSSVDSEELRIKKSSLILVPLIIGPAAFIWGMLYIYLEHYISASIPLSYTVISLYNLWNLHVTKNIVSLQRIQLVLVLILPFLLMWSLGGFSAGSFVFIWSFFAPIAALTYERKERALYWFYAFFILVVFSTIIDQFIAVNHVECMPILAVQLFYFLNVSAGLSGIYFLIKYFISETEKNTTRMLMAEHNELKRTAQELEEANNKLSHLANHDSLTNIPNRYYLRENIKKMISYANRHKHSIALLFLDLDNFKGINDRYGHAVGDEVLVEVTSRLSSLIREEDTIARLGGDEFAMVIGEVTSIDNIETITNRILIDVNKPYKTVNDETFQMGVSIGIAIYPEHAKEIDELINKADEAMYEIKNSGKNLFAIYQKKS